MVVKDIISIMAEYDTVEITNSNTDIICTVKEAMEEHKDLHEREVCGLEAFNGKLVIDVV